MKSFQVLRERLLWVYLAVAAGLLSAYLVFQTGTWYLLGGSVSLAAIVAGMIRNRPAVRLPWLLLAGGTLLWVFGDFIWYLPGPDGPSTYPSSVDYLYLLGYPAIAVSLGLLLHQGNDRGGVALLDAATITAGAGVLLWMRGLAPYFDGETVASVTVSILYVVFDLLLVGLAARMVLTGTRRTTSSMMMSVGLLALVLADLSSYLFTFESMLFWRALDAGWLISYFALGAAALHPSMARPATPVARRRAPSIVPFFVMAGGGVIAPLALLPHVLERDELDLLGPLIGGVLFFFLTLLRLRGLVHSLEGANRALATQGGRRVEAEQRYRTLVEQIPGISYVVEVGKDIRLSYVSPQVKDVLGYEPSEIVGGPTWRRMIHPDDLGIALGGYTPDVKTHDSTFRMIAKDGSAVWVTARVSRIEDDSRHLWQGIILDISDRKRIEELQSALKREQDAVEKLQGLDDMKNAFLQAVSHELRTPLTSIRGLGATLHNHLEDLPIEEVGDLVGRINANAVRLEQLLADLLDVDKLSRGIFLPQLTPADVGSIVEEMARSLSPDAAQNIDIRCAAVEIRTDASKVERITENLISNAIKHTPSDSTIWVSVEEHGGGGALICVEDSGEGIVGDMQETIFEPFRQWQSERTHSQGLGLGLSLVRRFAELLDGRAWVEDRPGGGASFYVWLPAKPAEVIQLQDAAQSL